MPRIHLASKQRINKDKTVVSRKHQDWACIGRIEVRINSLLGDGSYSWVRISSGLNKYVMELSETMSSSFETVSGASTGRPVSKLIPKQTSWRASSSGPRSTTGIPIHERKWIDVEPEEHDAHSFSVAKKRNKLLRHELPLLREEDGAIAFNKFGADVCLAI